jgi:hypothetical protein
LEEYRTRSKPNSQTLGARPKLRGGDSRIKNAGGGTFQKNLQGCPIADNLPKSSVILGSAEIIDMIWLSEVGGVYPKIGYSNMHGLASPVMNPDVSI